MGSERSHKLRRVTNERNQKKARIQHREHGESTEATEKGFFFSVPSVVLRVLCDPFSLLASFKTTPPGTKA
jgi:hypothetical protein